MSQNAEAALDDAWKLHAALQDWTKAVDSKASFALTLESAVLLATIAATGPDKRFGGVVGLSQWLYWLGLGLLGLALILCVIAVRPRLRSESLDAETATNFVYFGHLRHWNPEDLSSALQKKDLLPVLSRQAVAMSQICWRKHRLVQTSLTLAGLGGLMLSVAALTA